MRTLRTPEDRFAEPPDFGYQPGYAEVPDGDGGPKLAAVIAEFVTTG